MRGIPAFSDVARWNHPPPWNDLRSAFNRGRVVRMYATRCWSLVAINRGYPNSYCVNQPAGKTEDGEISLL